MLELGSEEFKKGHEVFTVGTLCQHEEWRVELLTYSANDSDAVTSVLVQDDLHWLVNIHPSRPHLDPHVERRLVSVDYHRLLLDQFGQCHCELLHFPLGPGHGLLVLVVRYVVAHLVLLVERTEGARLNADFPV